MVDARSMPKITDAMDQGMIRKQHDGIEKSQGTTEGTQNKRDKSIKRRKSNLRTEYENCGK